MATNTAGTNARIYHTHQTHYLRKRITFADDGTSVTVGKLPAYSTVINAGVVVVTAFNGNSSNVIDIGVTGNTDDFATGISLATAGVIQADDMATATSAYNTSDIDVVAAVTATASASAGVGYVFVEYLVADGDGSTPD